MLEPLPTALVSVPFVIVKVATRPHLDNETDKPLRVCEAVVYGIPRVTLEIVLVAISLWHWGLCPRDGNGRISHEEVDTNYRRINGRVSDIDSLHLSACI